MVSLTPWALLTVTKPLSAIAAAPRRELERHGPIVRISGRKVDMRSLVRLPPSAGALAVAGIAVMDDAAAIEELSVTGKLAVAIGPWDR